MKLLLVFLAAMVVLGLSTTDLDRRSTALIICCVVLTTVLYFGFQRFMSI